ncbi:MAG: T9SS type A sorting domain-containing protein, partial [Ignavibacteria bacterium]|nr:T9SS type A sorting domain-containing protein [Ignavibacteria bacterium]
NDTLNVAFVVLAGDDLPALQSTIVRAKQKWNQIITTVDETHPNENLTFNLYQNYPNPFNPNTTIKFSLPEKSEVTLKLYNSLGQEVKTLIDGKEFDRGIHNLIVNLSEFSSGTYIYQIRAGSKVLTRKMTLIK